MNYAVGTQYGVVRIEIDEQDFRSVAFDDQGQVIGEFVFVEEESEFSAVAVLKLVKAHLEGAQGKYKRMGLGKSILLTVREWSGLDIYTENHDGIRRDDGSHLTGDAPAFVESMRREGILIAP